MQLKNIMDIEDFFTINRTQERLLIPLLQSSIKFNASKASIDFNRTKNTIFFRDNRMNSPDFEDLFSISKPEWSSSFLIHQAPPNLGIIALAYFSKKLTIKTNHGSLTLDNPWSHFIDIDTRNILNKINFSEKVNGIEISAILKEAYPEITNLEYPFTFKDHSFSLAQKKYLETYFALSLLDLDITLNSVTVKKMSYDKENYKIHFKHRSGNVYLNKISDTLCEPNFILAGQQFSPFSRKTPAFYSKVFKALNKTDLMASDFFPDLFVAKKEVLTPTFDFYNHIQENTIFENLIKKIKEMKLSYK